MACFRFPSVPISVYAGGVFEWLSLNPLGVYTSIRSLRLRVVQKAADSPLHASGTASPGVLDYLLDLSAAKGKAAFQPGFCFLKNLEP